MKRNEAEKLQGIAETAERIKKISFWTDKDQATFNQSRKDALFAEAAELIKKIGGLPE